MNNTSSDRLTAASELLPAAGLAASLRRIGAMITRYWYLIRSSVPRMLELIYWPLVQMLMWGFLQTHLASQSSVFAQAAGLLIAGVLLWDILVRTQLGFSISFLEEMWSRNLGHLLMSPLRPTEFLAALMAVSMIRLAIGLVPVAILAYFFFDFNLLSLGLAFIAFFANLVFVGWAFSFATSGFILRYGLGAEGIAWTVAFLLLPISCAYYPVTTLPNWLQWVALSLPPAHVFEGMRTLLTKGEFASGHMLIALGLNVIYITVGFLTYHRLLASARNRGSLLQMGE